MITPVCVPPLYKRKSLEKNQLSAFLHRAKRAISTAGSLQYKIIWRNEGLVLNWQTIPSNLFVQPRSIYLRFQIFYYTFIKIPLSSGFVYFIAHKHNELLAGTKVIIIITLIITGYFVNWLSGSRQLTNSWWTVSLQIFWQLAINFIKFALNVGDRSLTGLSYKRNFINFRSGVMNCWKY